MDGWTFILIVGILALLAAYIRSQAETLTRNGLPADREDEP